MPLGRAIRTLVIVLLTLGLGLMSAKFLHFYISLFFYVCFISTLITFTFAFFSFNAATFAACLNYNTSYLPCQPLLAFLAKYLTHALIIVYVYLVVNKNSTLICGNFESFENICCLTAGH